MIDISYRIFDLVASTNSLTKTAEIVHLTPSAVSHSLRKLEERLGMQLVVRNRDGLRLTQYGQELIPPCPLCAEGGGAAAAGDRADL